MGRPALPEHRKLKSFPVRLAPKSMGRWLQLCSIVEGLPTQELLRRELEPAIRALYERHQREGARLPPLATVSAMSEEEFAALVNAGPSDGPPLRRRGRLVKRGEAAVA